MFPGLRILLAALLLAAAQPAFAGPDDPFRVSAPGALSSFQRSVLLGLDGGRFAIEKDFVLDSRGKDPKKPLTVAEVERLLRGPALADAGALYAAGAGKVRPVLSVPKPPSDADFDGGRGRGAIVGGAGSALGRELVKDPAILQANLLRRLVFTGTAQERAAIAAALSTILETRTGRDIAAEFVAENASAEIRMGDVAGSEMTTKDGKKQFQGSGGSADTYKDPPRVTINRHYLESDAEYRRVAMAGTLAHELFGHAFEAQRARKTGLPRSVQYYYRGDEIGSQLVDWLVQTELKGEVLDGDPDSYLADPEKYYKSLWPMDAYYAVTLSPKEMSDPVAALRPRLKYVRDDRARTKADRKQMKEWIPIRDHFIKVHGLAAARFAQVDERLRAFELYAANRLKELDEIETHLSETIAAWAEKGSREPLELKAGAKAAYVRDADARVSARTKALLKLRADKRGPASVSSDGVLEMPPLVIRGAADPANEPIDLEMLGVLYDEDREKNPGHWKK